MKQPTAIARLREEADWFHDLGDQAKKAYLKVHPNSKWAGKGDGAGDSSTPASPAKPAAPTAKLPATPSTPASKGLVSHLTKNPETLKPDSPNRTKAAEQMKAVVPKLMSSVSKQDQVTLGASIKKSMQGTGDKIKTAAFAAASGGALGAVLGFAAVGSAD